MSFKDFDNAMTEKLEAVSASSCILELQQFPKVMFQLGRLEHDSPWFAAGTRVGSYPMRLG
jgi:hypothetical protein